MRVIFQFKMAKNRHSAHDRTTVPPTGGLSAIRKLPTFWLSDTVMAISFARASFEKRFAFVLRKSMQTGKEPVKVALRLAFARP
jgi:hypothetical protein